MNNIYIWYVGSIVQEPLFYHYYQKKECRAHNLFLYHSFHSAA